MFPCSEEHGIFFISKFNIIVEHQLNDDLKVILTTLIYLYKFIMIEAFWDFYIKRLGYSFIALNSASAMYISFLGGHDWTLANHTAYII